LDTNSKWPRRLAALLLTVCLFTLRVDLPLNGAVQDRQHSRLSFTKTELALNASGVTSRAASGAFHSATLHAKHLADVPWVHRLAPDPAKPEPVPNSALLPFRTALRAPAPGRSPPVSIS
jgi:hypothetical protein